MSNIDYSLLQKQGYIVIPNFLNQKEIDFFKKDFEVSKPAVYLPNYNLRQVSHNIFKLLEKKLDKAVTTIAGSTDIDVNFVIPLARYYDNQVSAVPMYHLDHESFYLLQQYYNYLNFWIPITKPNENQSGLSVIPADRLQNIDPVYAEKIRGYGAIRLYPNSNNTTTFIDDNTGEESLLQFNIDEIAETPILRPGDALIMRGDTVHKTQDLDTERLAITVRCTNGNAPISKSKLLDCRCDKKQKSINGIPMIIDKLSRLVAAKNSDTITAREYYTNN